MTKEDSVSKKDSMHTQFLKQSGVIILAAGASVRMGQSKQLLQVGGESLLVRVIRTAVASEIKNIAVVLGAYEMQHRAAIEHFPVELVYNESWQRGMGSSLKSGLYQLRKTYPSLNSIVVLVCDQPLLTHAHIHALIEAHFKTGKKIVASHYSDTVGVPAFFEKGYFEILADMNDQHGAKKIIQQFQHDVSAIEFPAGEVDLDTMEDYNNFKRNIT